MNKLHAKIAELERQLAILKNDKAFGGLTRGGLEIEFERRQPDDCYVVFTDLDGIHSLNEQYGYERVDQMIRESLSIRHDDLVMFGRWKSGDEIVFIVCSNPDGFIDRVQNSLKEHGLSGTFAYEPINGNSLFYTVQICIERVTAAKLARGHKR